MKRAIATFEQLVIGMEVLVDNNISSCPTSTPKIRVVDVSPESSDDLWVLFYDLQSDTSFKENVDCLSQTFCVLYDDQLENLDRGDKFCRVMGGRSETYVFTGETDGRSNYLCVEVNTGHVEYFSAATMVYLKEV